MNRLFKCRTMMILITCFLFAFASASAEMFLPTPEPAGPVPTPGGPLVLPTDEAPAGIEPLPVLSSLLQLSGEKKADFLDSDAYHADAILYPTVPVGNVISEYLVLCTEKGYQWELSNDFANAIAYRITGGGYTAYLVPDYGSQILLLTEKEMPVAEDNFVQEDYVPGKLMLTVNGAQYTLDEVDRVLTVDDFLGVNFESGLTWEYAIESFRQNRSIHSDAFDYYGKTAGSPYSFSSSVHQYKFLYLSVPVYTVPATYTITRDSNPQDISFMLKGPDGDYVVDIERFNESSVAGGWNIANGAGRHNKSIGLDDAQDYLTVNVLFRNAPEGGPEVCQISFTGSFRKGTIQVSGTMYSQK